MAKLNLNPADFENISDGAPEILPVGDYTMQIVQSDLRDTKAGDGQYLWLELEILGPKYMGRKYWERVNLFNKNETTVKIARKTLSNICAALGFSALPDDSEQLHFKPLKVVITHKENKMGNLETRAAYYPTGASTPAAPAAPAPAQTGAAPKPWERHKK